MTDQYWIGRLGGTQFNRSTHLGVERLDEGRYCRRVGHLHCSDVVVVTRCILLSHALGIYRTVGLKADLEFRPTTRWI